MSVPCNPQDYARFKALADLVANTPGSELSIYVSDGYVSLDMKGRTVPKAELFAIFGVPSQIAPEAATDAGESLMGSSYSTEKP